MVDGKVTRQEFRNYYHSVSSGIEVGDDVGIVVGDANGTPLGMEVGEAVVGDADGTPLGIEVPIG